jgi:hypothetical protein
VNHKGNKFRILFFVILFLPLFLASSPQDSKVHQRQITHDREKKEKMARKNYEKAVKQHNNNQSKETKAMMKQARKSKGKNTPVKHSSGTKCK